MTNAAIDYECLGKILKRQRPNLLQLNPFIRRRDARYGLLAVNPKTESQLPAITRCEPVYPMLHAEFVTGVENVLRWSSRKWPLFQQALQQLLDVSVFEKPNIERIQREETRGAAAARLMRRMELCCLAFPEKYSDVLKEASQFFKGCLFYLLLVDAFFMSRSLPLGIARTALQARCSRG